MKALFPGTCVLCGQPIVPGEQVEDSGQRGPRGGKKLGHASCVGGRSKRNPSAGVWSKDPKSWGKSGLRRWRVHFVLPRGRTPIVVDATSEGAARRKVSADIGIPGQIEDLGSAVYQNPQPWWPHPSMMIPSDWPPEMYQYAPKPILGHWTTNPEYVYEQFARDNGLLDDIRSGKAIDSYIAGKKGGLTAIISYYDGRIVKVHGVAAKSLAEHRRRTWYEQHGIKNPRRSRRNPQPLRTKPQPVLVYVDVPTNAGPYLPEMFPYGVGGRPVEYEQLPTVVKPEVRKNPGPRGGFSPTERSRLPKSGFLKPESRGWPVHDRNHAHIAIQYMTRGFGDRSEYPTLIRRLAGHWPPGPDTADIWDFYEKNRAGIEAMAGRRMPTVSGLAKRRAA